MSCVDLMAATTAKERRKEGRRGDFHYHYLLRPPLVAIVVNLVVSLTAGLLASPKSKASERERGRRGREGERQLRIGGALGG